MLTYNLNDKNNRPLYIWLSEHIKADIENGILCTGEKLPSKRGLADHLKISVITVQSAYNQLISEGYIYSREKRGYYVTEIQKPLSSMTLNLDKTESMLFRKKEVYDINLCDNNANPAIFPFSVWVKLMRSVIAEHYDDLLSKVAPTGLWELRKAICDYLLHFRGINADPEQVFIGSGTEYLYSVIIKLLGRDTVFAVEDPGYQKLIQIYRAEDINVKSIPIDENGLSYHLLKESNANVVHISPSHHFPSGIIMPVSRRYELLGWAHENDAHYVIEDDYDSEFRFTGKPLPTMFSLDKGRKTIYMNTFSKTISPSLRISYMILPQQLVGQYNTKLYFYSCTVPSIEQYTLAEFISKGHFERHLNKMKRYYNLKRNEILALIKNSKIKDSISISEEKSGLHFTLKLKTDKKDNDLKKEAAKFGLKIAFISDYSEIKENAASSTLLLNYSTIKDDDFKFALEILEKII